MNLIEVAEKFCAAWSSPNAEAFSSLFAPDGYYTDIAFGVTRRGRENVREHHKILAIGSSRILHDTGACTRLRTSRYCPKRYVKANFLVATLAEAKSRPPHKSFRARAIAVLEINDRAEITACTEYYDRTTMPIGEPTPFNDLTWPQNELFVPSTDVRNVSAPLVQRENDRVHRLTIDGQDWNDRYPFF